MALEATADRSETQAWINFLQSGFQGLFVLESALAQLGYEGERFGEVDDYRETLDWLGERASDLEQGEALFADGEPDEGGEVAVRMAALLRSEKLALAKRLTEAIIALGRDADANAAKFVAAVLAQHAYARQHFVHGLVRYGELFAREEVSDRWRQHLPGCQHEVAEAHSLMSRIAQGELADELFRFELRNEALPLPGVLYTQANDLRVLDLRRQKKLAFEHMGWAPEEAAPWRATGFTPDVAGHWRALGFDPGETRAWIVAGFPDALMAAAWRSRGFTVEQAAAWRDDGFDARDSFKLRAAGAPDPDSARALIERARAR